MNKSIISEAALRCNDISFRDFDSTIYERCLLRASRKVARRYQLIQRIYEFNSVIPIPENVTEEEYVEDKVKIDIVLPIPSFVSEYEVIINNIGYSKRNNVTEDKYEYTLYRDHNSLLFNYSPRSKDDTVIIKYNSDINEDDYDVEEIAPVIPSQYTEELIDFTVVEVSKLGIVKYPNSERGQKYERALSLHTKDPRDLDSKLMKNDSWATVKVWSPY